MDVNVGVFFAQMVFFGWRFYGRIGVFFAQMLFLSRGFYGKAEVFGFFF